MKIIGAALSGALVFASLTPVFASAASDAVAKACPAGAGDSTPLTASCVQAVCALVSNSSGASSVALRHLGEAIGALVSKNGDSDASAADSIQACVAQGPKKLIAGYEGEVPTSVADIGSPTHASAP